MPVAQAEELKKQYGHCVVTSVPLHAEIEIANPNPSPHEANDASCGPRSQRLELRSIAEILEPRARELMYFVKESLRYGRVENALGAGCVITGGGSLVPGLLDVAESQLRVPARTATPVRLSQMPGELVHPGFSAAIGMLLYAHRTRMTRAAEDNSLRAKLRAVFAASF